jgi:hypothetical protein
MKRRTISYGTMAALALTACAANDLSPITMDDGASSSGAAGGTSTTGATGGGTSSTGATGDSTSVGCGASQQLVYLSTYVLDGANVTQQALYSFDPATLTVTEIGPLACPMVAGSDLPPLAMALDRQGTLWALAGAALYHIDTRDARCTATAFQPSADMMNVRLGIGFASDTPGGSTETAYLSTPKGLAKLDQQSLQVTPIGDFDADFFVVPDWGPTLAGTSDAQLFGVWGGFAVLGRIDPSSAHIESWSQLPATVNKGYAAIVWGGDVWIFGDPSSTGSAVLRHDTSTGTTTTVVPNLGFTVGGAGVSTCAPLTPPT